MHIVNIAKQCTQDNYNIRNKMRVPIAFQASHNQDTMYFHQYMLQPDKDTFLRAIYKDINGHIYNSKG